MKRAIGDTVWLFDENRRVYRGGQSGPVFREHFVKHRIANETRTSWIIEGTAGWKIDKTTEKLRKPECGWSPIVYWCGTDIDNVCYVNDNRYKIAQAVQSCNDANVLKAIDRILLVTGLKV